MQEFQVLLGKAPDCKSGVTLKRTARRSMIRKEAAWEAASILVSEWSVSWRLTSRTD